MPIRGRIMEPAVAGGGWLNRRPGRGTPIAGDNTIITRAMTAAPSAQQQRSLEQACLCAKVAADFRGQDTVVLDLTEVTPIFDYFVITTGTSKRQMHAIADEASRLLKSEGARRMGVEGRDSSSWILQDYGDVVLHVFNPEARHAYDLEHLWADARRVDWREVLQEPKKTGTYQ